MRSPPGPDARFPRYDPTWDDVLASWGMVAAIPFLLWALSAPLAAALTVITVAGLVVVGRRAVRLVACLRHCRSLTVHLRRDVHLVVGDPCVPEARAAGTDATAPDATCRP